MSASNNDAFEDPKDALTVEALFKRALALRQAHDWREAVTCLDEILWRFENDDVDQYDLRRRSAAIKIVCLDERRQQVETALACDAFLSRYEGDRSRDHVGLAADVLWLKSRALNRSGRRKEERDVLQKLISDYVDEPLARSGSSGDVQRGHLSTQR